MGITDLIDFHIDFIDWLAGITDVTVALNNVVLAEAI